MVSIVRLQNFICSSLRSGNGDNSDCGLKMVEKNPELTTETSSSAEKNDEDYGEHFYMEL